MSGTDPFDDGSPGREPLRAALALVCILAVILAAAALPTLGLAGAVGSDAGDAVPFGDRAGAAGSQPIPGEGTATPGDGNSTPSERVERPSQPVGATPTGSQPPDDAAGSGAGGSGQSGAGTAGNGTTAGETGGQPGAGEAGTRTSGDGTSGDGQTSGDGTGDQTSGDGTGSGDGAGDQTSGDGTGGDGDTDGDQTGDSDSSGQTSDGDTGGDQASDGDSSGGDDTAEGSDGETGDGSQTASYDVSLNRSATAGAVVEVTVTRGGSPAAGVAVSFNGDPIGTTDGAGTAVGRVPYDDQLNITVDPGARQSLSAPPRYGDRLFALSAPPPAQVANESFAVDTNVSLSLSGPVVTGRTVTLTATIDDVPVRSAAVRLDGERVGTTNDSGRLEVALPTEPGNYTVVVSRDAVSGERTVTLDGLSVATEPALPVALPGTGLAVTVTAGGEPVPNATVVLDGAAVAETDGNGTALVTLPFAGSATVTVRQYGQVSERVVGGLYTNFAGVLVGALALAAGAGYLLRRRGVSRATVSGWLRRATQLAVNGLLWLAAALDSALGRLRTRLVLTVAALRAFLARRRTPAELWAALRAWAAARVAAVRASADTAAAAARNADPRTDDTPRVDDRTTIRAAWGRFVDHVSVRRTGTATPGEIAAHAVEADDLPAEAVGTLREAYRAVEYGQYDPGDHVSAVESAIETIERSVEDADDGGEAAA